MIQGETMIYAPVSLEDPYSVMGVTASGMYDLAYICSNSHGKTNRWAMYKPEAIGGLAEITLAQRQANKFGLAPVENAKALAVCSGYGGTSYDVGATGYTMDDIEAANKVWTYTAPVPGTHWCRLTDFVPEGTAGAIGYRHDTASPVDGWGEWTIEKYELENLVEKEVDVTLPGSSADSWQIEDIFVEYSQFNARLTENSATNIGTPGTGVIPLSYLLGGVSTEYWRIGILVHVPGQTKLHLAVSNYPLNAVISASSAMVSARAFPSLTTNQYLAQLMLNRIGSSSSLVCRALPVMVRGCIQSTAQMNGNVLTMVSMSGSSTKIYSVPSDTVAINVVIKNDGTSVKIPGVVAVNGSASGGFVLATVGTGIIADGPNGTSAEKRPVIALCILLADQGSTLSSSKRVTYNVTVGYGWEPRTKTTRSSTVTISPSSTVTYNGVTYKGTSIQAQPALSVVTCEKLQVV